MRSNFIAAHLFDWWVWYAGFAVLIICVVTRRWKLLFLMFAILVIANMIAKVLLLQ